MQERKFEGVCWRELAIVWQLPTAECENINFDSDYDKIQFFLYAVWKRTVCKKKSYIRMRVAEDLRQYARTLSENKHNVYKYVWEALSYIRDDNEVIKISIALIPYMWH